MISLPIGLKQSVKKNNNEPLWIREPTTNPVWGGGGQLIYEFLMGWGDLNFNSETHLYSFYLFFFN